MVEAWFGIFTRKSVRRGSFDSVRALIRHLESYIADWNSHPTPFEWTKDPATIVMKALRRGGLTPATGFGMYVSFSGKSRRRSVTSPKSRYYFSARL